MDKITFGQEALNIIADLLETNPFDLDALIDRLRLNADVFDNMADIVTDAQYIIDTDEFGTRKMLGYDWLFWVYQHKMGMPEKAFKIIEDQLIETQLIFSKTHEKNEQEGVLLNKLAFLKFGQGNVEDALSLWIKSYDKNPYLDERNAIVAIELLKLKQFKEATKFINEHIHASFNYNDGYRLKYGLILKSLFDANELDNEPQLQALLFFIIRNETAAFGLENKLDFYNTFLPTLEKLAAKHPKNATFWTAIGNTYLLDVKNYEKALFAYTKMLEGDNPYLFADMERIYKCAKKTNSDFLELPFTFEGSSFNMYNIATDISDFGNKTNKKKKKKKYIKLAVKFGAICYQQYKDFLINGDGDPHNNQSHMFAMSCNNYANYLGNYADTFQEKEDLVKTYIKAANIHLEGYVMSPFKENLSNASSDFFFGEDYEQCIKYALESITTYGAHFNMHEYQNHYWLITRSYMALDEIENAEKYYLIAKELFLKIGKGSKSATTKFIFTAKLFYEYAVDSKAYEKYIPELSWYISEKVALELEPKEHGLVLYLLGVCYRETNKKEAAISVLKQCINQLQEYEFGYYYELSEKAANIITDYGEKSGHKYLNKSPKKKNLLLKIWNGISMSFIIFGVMSAMLLSVFLKKKQKNKTGK